MRIWRNILNKIIKTGIHKIIKNKIFIYDFIHLSIYAFTIMPSRNQSGKPEHIHQNANRKRAKSGKRYPKLFAHGKLLKKKEAQQ